MPAAPAPASAADPLGKGIGVARGQAMIGEERHDVVVLIPVFNDWVACGMLLEGLDSAMAEAGRRVSVLLVDDGSTLDSAALRTPAAPRALDSVDVLLLRRNLGHQRAIGVGLAWIHENRPCDAVVVMDADGEDDPRVVPQLLERCGRDAQRRIVFAERRRRSEGAVFKVFYLIFKIVHRLLTGLAIRVGNFSVVPYERIGALTTLPDLWSHYAAAVFVSRIPYATVPSDRAKRLGGSSSMNFPSLVNHGLSAIAVFSEVVSVRVLIATLGGVLVTVVAMLLVLGIRIFTDLAIPGWATFAMGLLLLLLVQGIFFALLFSFTVLGNRKAANVLLARDHPHFVAGVVRLPAGTPATASKAAGA
jgi:polyisoprenyl-phosphate glycosyltransferase